VLSVAQLDDWLGPMTQLGLLGPALPHEQSWTQPKKIKIKIKFSPKIISKKSMIFPRAFLLNFA